MKNNMDYFKTMNEKDLDLTKTAVDWTDKAFRGNGDCAAIARTTGKTCKVVLRDGEDTSFLEGIHAFLLKNGKLDAECSWKSENGVENLPIWYSTYLIGQFRLILRFDIRSDKFFGIVIKIAHLYGFQGSWNVIPRMLAKIIDGIPI